jgi:hypothetical protein
VEELADMLEVGEVASEDGEEADDTDNDVDVEGLVEALVSVG